MKANLGHVTTTMKDEYRIMSRAPGKRKFEFRHFTGAVARSPEEAEMTLARIRDESPGWAFRVETRTLTIIATDWIPA